MPGIAAVIVSAVAAVLLLYALQRFRRHARRRQTRLVHGCRDVAWYPHTDRERGADLTALRKQAIRHGRLKMLFLEHHRTLGETWAERIDGQVRVYTIRRENVRYIFASHTRDFTWQPKKQTASFRLLGTRGFFGSPDDAKQARKLITPTFTRYENGTMPMLQAHVDRFVEGLPRDGQAFDLQPLIKRLFLDLATEFLFDVPLGMQLPAKRNDAEEFLASFDATLLGIHQRQIGLSWSSIYGYLFDRSFERGLGRIHSFVDDMVQAAIDRADRSAASDKDKARLEQPETESKPGRYILVDELVKQTRDRALLRDCMLQAFVPARENAAILTSNTFWALSRHPEYWRRARTVAVALSEAEILSFPKLVGLSQIRHLVLEAVGLYGPGGANTRRALSDVVLPKGGGSDGESPLFVPKGTLVSVHTPVMHRNKRYWGPDADEYRPERFEGRDIAQDWEFVPFLAGPKACPAKHQVIMQATYILVRLLRKFESIKCAGEVERFVESVKLTTESKRGCQIALVPAK